MKHANNCHSMQVALKILGSVADVGFTKSPEDQAKRSSLVRGLFRTKYQIMDDAEAAIKKAEESCL